MGKHYFLLKAVDNNYSYQPESKLVIDLESANELFAGENAQKVRLNLREIADELAETWNMKHARNHGPIVSLSLFL